LFKQVYFCCWNTYDSICLHQFMCMVMFMASFSCCLLVPARFVCAFCYDNRKALVWKRNVNMCVMYTIVSWPLFRMWHTSLLCVAIFPWTKNCDPTDLLIQSFLYLHHRLFPPVSDHLSLHMAFRSRKKINIELKDR